MVWRRGTLDDKASLTCILEGVEAQVLAGHRPEADIDLSFGRDEETEGSGARTIVELLETRGIRPYPVIDEGGAAVEPILPGITGLNAVVGVSEKGTLSLTLTVEQQGGHASTPTRLCATARLSTAVVRLNSRPFLAGFAPTTSEMIRTTQAVTMLQAGQAASDSRSFARISDFVYRFSPFEMPTDERETLHAIDEQIHVSTLLRGVRFSTRLVGRL